MYFGIAFFGEKEVWKKQRFQKLQNKSLNETKFLRSNRVEQAFPGHEDHLRWLKAEKYSRLSKQYGLP